MTKQKKSSEFCRMKIGKFLWKRQTWENFPRSQKYFSGIGGNLKQGGNASLPQRDGRPWQFLLTFHIEIIDLVECLASPPLLSLGLLPAHIMTKTQYEMSHYFQ